MRYADHGWPVLPLHTPAVGGCSCTRTGGCGSPGKHPRTRHGLHEASTDPAQVRAWWNRWPDANIGIATGPGSGLLVLDIDLPHGPASLAELEATHGPLPLTCEQRTGSGGRQLLFTHPDAAVGNRAAAWPGVDVRGTGGYIVVPPSRHPCGDRYRWTGRTPPAAPPDWLVDLLDRDRIPAPPHVDRPTVRVEATGQGSTYATTALTHELTALAGAVEGTRNHTLNRAAFNLGQLVGAGALDAEHVTARLRHVATDIGLGPTEAARTIASGLNAGIARPRPIPTRADTPPTGASKDGVPVRRALVRRR